MSHAEEMAQHCRACGATRGYRLLSTFRAPLSTAGWPSSPDDAQGMAQQPIDLFACQQCGHIQNACFNPHVIPMAAGLRMHNHGHHWSVHLDRMAMKVLAAVAPQAVVLDIGCGGGEFLERLRAHRPTLRGVGIDPAAPANPTGWRSIRRTVQDGDIRSINPDVVVLRHVLEHLDQPRRFLESLASECIRPIHLFIEVPNGQPALEQGRLADWLYEHCSHFRTSSLHALLASIHATEIQVEDDVDGEVLWSMSRMAAQRSAPPEVVRYQQLCRARLATQPWVAPTEAREVVVWGGTGKAAALLNRIKPDGRVRVVDGDSRKVGGWVPGVGLPIQHPSVVGEAPDVVVPSRWRLPDILIEMESANIRPRAIWVEKNGAIYPWEGDETS